MVLACPVASVLLHPGRTAPAEGADRALLLDRQWNTFCTVRMLTSLRGQHLWRSRLMWRLHGPHGGRSALLCLAAAGRRQGDPASRPAPGAGSQRRSTQQQAAGPQRPAGNGAGRKRSVGGGRREGPPDQRDRRPPPNDRDADSLQPDSSAGVPQATFVPRYSGLYGWQRPAAPATASCLPPLFIPCPVAAPLPGANGKRKCANAGGPSGHVTRNPLTPRAGTPPSRTAPGTRGTLSWWRRHRRTRRKLCPPRAWTLKVTWVDAPTVHVARPPEGRQVCT
jgi:hypothetical protein